MKERTKKILWFIIPLLFFSCVGLTTYDRDFKLYWHEPRLAEYVFSFTFVVLIITAIYGLITRHRGGS